MKLYKGTLCTMILAGTLDEAPIVYKTNNGKQVAEFFLTIYKSATDLNDTQTSEQFFLYRITARNSEAIKIKQHAQHGAQLFVEGALQSYHVTQSNEKNYVIAEVSASKLWFVSSPEINQLKMRYNDTQLDFSSRNICDVRKSQYVH